MDKYIEFAKALNRLAAETGVVISEFGDPFYNPRLVTKHGEDLWLFFVWDGERYEIRKDDPYSGEVVDY